MPREYIYEPFIKCSVTVCKLISFFFQMEVVGSDTRDITGQKREMLLSGFIEHCLKFKASAVLVCPLLILSRPLSFYLFFLTTLDCNIFFSGNI